MNAPAKLADQLLRGMRSLDLGKAAEGVLDAPAKLAEQLSTHTAQLAKATESIADASTKLTEQITAHTAHLAEAAENITGAPAKVAEQLTAQSAELAKATEGIAGAPATLAEQLAAATQTTQLAKVAEGIAGGPAALAAQLPGLPADSPASRAAAGVFGAPSQVAEQISGAVQMPHIDDWTCRPNKEHPRPVVLVHGTFGNAMDYWVLTAPMLAAAGFTVFRLDYGALPGIPILHGLDTIENSAKQLAAFVDRVLESTGAEKVDLVGHSQGGMMPRYYLKFLNGASKVNRLIALAPSSHGMAELGIVKLAKQFPGAEELIARFMPPACADQTAGSALMTKLNSDGDTMPGVKYTVIASKHDQVVTPFQSSFLQGDSVHNIVLQDLHPLDFSDHGAMSFNPLVFREVIKHLGS